MRVDWSGKSNYHGMPLSPPVDAKAIEEGLCPICQQHKGFHIPYAQHDPALAWIPPEVFAFFAESGATIVNYNELTTPTELPMRLGIKGKEIYSLSPGAEPWGEVWCRTIKDHIHYKSSNREQLLSLLRAAAGVQAAKIVKQRRENLSRLPRITQMKHAQRTENQNLEGWYINQIKNLSDKLMLFLVVFGIEPINGSHPREVEKYHPCYLKTPLDVPIQSLRSEM